MYTKPTHLNKAIGNLGKKGEASKDMNLGSNMFRMSQVSLFWTFDMSFLYALHIYQRKFS